MSVSSVFDDARSKLLTLFPNKTEIPNPYQLDSNKDIFLRDGFGIGFGATIPSVNQDNQNVNSDYILFVILSREVTRLESDPSILQTQVKLLFEDAESIKSSFATVARINPPDSDEPEPIWDEKYSNVYIRLNFNFFQSTAFAGC